MNSIHRHQLSSIEKYLTHYNRQQFVRSRSIIISVNDVEFQKLRQHPKIVDLDVDNTLALIFSTNEAINKMEPWSKYRYTQLSDDNGTYSNDLKYFENRAIIIKNVPDLSIHCWNRNTENCIYGLTVLVRPEATLEMLLQHNYIDTSSLWWERAEEAFLKEFEIEKTYTRFEVFNIVLNMMKNERLKLGGPALMTTMKRIADSYDSKFGIEKILQKEAPDLRPCINKYHAYIYTEQLYGFLTFRSFKTFMYALTLPKRVCQRFFNSKILFFSSPLPDIFNSFNINGILRKGNHNSLNGYNPSVMRAIVRHLENILKEMQNQEMQNVLSQEIDLKKYIRNAIYFQNQDAKVRVHLYIRSSTKNSAFKRGSLKSQGRHALNLLYTSFPQFQSMISKNQKSNPKLNPNKKKNQSLRLKTCLEKEKIWDDEEEEYTSDFEKDLSEDFLLYPNYNVKFHDLAQGPVPDAATNKDTYAHLNKNRKGQTVSIMEDEGIISNNDSMEDEFLNNIFKEMDSMNDSHENLENEDCQITVFPYLEVGSAYNDSFQEREAFNALLQNIHENDIVIFASPERLARRIHEWHIMLNMLLEKKAIVITSCWDPLKKIKIFHFGVPNENVVFSPSSCSDPMIKAWIETDFDLSSEHATYSQYFLNTLNLFHRIEKYKKKNNSQNPHLLSILKKLFNSIDECTGIVRISNERRENNSKLIQTSLMNMFCPNVKQIHQFTTSIFSCSFKDHPINHILKDIQPNTCILVYSIDRLCRSIDHWEKIKKMAIKKKATLVFLQLPQLWKDSLSNLWTQHGKHLNMEYLFAQGRDEPHLVQLRREQMRKIGLAFIHLRDAPSFKVLYNDREGPLYKIHTFLKHQLQIKNMTKPFSFPLFFKPSNMDPLNTSIDIILSSIIQNCENFTKSVGHGSFSFYSSLIEPGDRIHTEFKGKNPSFNEEFLAELLNYYQQHFCVKGLAHFHQPFVNVHMPKVKKSFNCHCCNTEMASKCQYSICMCSCNTCKNFCNKSSTSIIQALCKQCGTLLPKCYNTHTFCNERCYVLYCDARNDPYQICACLDCTNISPPSWLPGKFCRSHFRSIKRKYSDFAQYTPVEIDSRLKKKQRLAKFYYKDFNTDISI